MASTSADVGKVWTFFDQSAENFMIKPLSNAQVDEAISLIQQVLLDDHIVNALGFRSDKKSTESLESLIKSHLTSNLTFGCYLGRTDQLIGVDVIYIRHINDDHINSSPRDGEAFCKYMRYLKFVQRQLRYHGAEKRLKYLSSLGMFLLPEYRSSDIERHMLRIRGNAALYWGIVFNGDALIEQRIQNYANELKYKLYEEIREDNLERYGLEYLRGADVFPIKIMGKLKTGPKPECQTWRQA
ncbi:hypothetical protein HW555_008749 [Spodoptera exigua]|uniref:Uncharacterized protein n=2 Tax=Spodoptera exigua TaxID=7107 RepID=A0A835GCF4_SPOEX|nr:hypothetical protein HW555_008749 [Spodoptera exigua]